MVSVMEKPQTNDSFQHELEDFIRKQKARGVHPRLCFRKTTEDSVHQDRGRVGPEAPMLGLPLWSRRYARSFTAYERPTAENPVPHSRQKLESLRHHQENLPVSQDGKERTRCQEEGRATSEEPGMPKGRHHRERGSHREDWGLCKRKPSAEPVATEKCKQRKKNHHDRRDAAKGRHRSHREKKRMEERDLWDEAILGSCY
ncbi:zinc finger matrin-type protein 1-like [Acomys russatus]|uniref:zinc finger matrin-type protein 1-like n=1 Tax=Acomys russatus TaxID=60746 RepID=UPI0021E2BEFB|nr:zinc finger matrin-type protein 1-like [Acomys russatus]